jgi:hypothetical protein
MTTFHQVSSITNKNRISLLEDNVKSFLDWSFLHIGGFVNVNIPTSGIAGGNFHTLKNASDPVLKDRVWQSPRKDWVYETGVVYESGSPVVFSGIYLNSTFLPAPTGSGNYGYNINYPLGQVVFDKPVSSNSNITASYSYRYIQVYKSSDNFWWKEVQKETYNPANFNKQDYSITSVHRVQLPAIVVELIPRTVQIPYQLGSADNIIIQDVFLHIYSENANQRNIIADALIHQKDKTLRLYDISHVIKNNKYSLNKFGNINPSGYNYPQLVNLFSNYWCTIKDSNIVELNSLSSSLHNGIVRWSIEIFP